MRIIQQKDLPYAKCYYCKDPAKYMTRLSYPTGVSEEYDFCMRFRICLCSQCLNTLYNLGIKFY